MHVYLIYKVHIWSNTRVSNLQSSPTDIQTSTQWS